MVTVIQHITPKRRPPYGEWRALYIIVVLIILNLLFACSTREWDNLGKHGAQKISGTLL